MALACTNVPFGGVAPRMRPRRKAAGLHGFEKMSAALCRLPRPSFRRTSPRAALRSMPAVPAAERC